MARLRAVQRNCPPRVLGVLFRSLWKCWVTYCRMKKLLDPRPCVLGCSWEDELGHYVCCSIYWSFLSKPWPQGLGITAALRGKDSSFLLSPLLYENGAVRLAAGLLALYRTVNHYMFSGSHANNPRSYHKFTMLRIFSKRALEHSSSFRLLWPSC